MLIKGGFGGGRKTRFYCILIDRSGPTKHFMKTMCLCTKQMPPLQFYTIPSKKFFEGYFVNAAKVKL